MTERQRTTSRRALLSAGAVAAASSLAGCSLFGGTKPGNNSTTGSNETATGTQTTTAGERNESDLPITLPPHDTPFDTVVDVVEDAGADPTGGESIIPILEKWIGPDTLFYFPEGTYLMDGLWEVPSFSRLAIAGKNATIRPPDGYSKYLFALGRPGQASTAFVQGLTFDFRAPNTAPRPLQVDVNDHLVVRDIDVRGSSGTSRFDVTSPSGVGLVERLRVPGGGAKVSDVGCLVGPVSTGTLTFKDCTIAGFGNNGLYASPARGEVRVIGGSYRNSAIANVRVSSPCLVRDVHVRCDRAPSGFRNMRGIRLRAGKTALVENCTVEMIDTTYSEGAIVLEGDMETATIRDTQIVATADRVPAINAKSPSNASTNAGTAIDCQNVHITGSASDGSAIKVVDRDACRFDGVCLRQTGNARNGLYLLRSPNGVLQDVAIDVSGEPLVLQQSPLARRGVSVGPGVACPPSTTTGGQ